MSHYTPHQVADMFQVSYHAVLRAIDRGELEAERVFNRLRISPEALEAYRAANRTQAQAKPILQIAVEPRRRHSSERGGTGSLAALKAIEGGAR